MEAVLTRAIVAVGGAIVAGGYGHGNQVPAIGSSIVAPRAPADSSRTGSFRQSGFIAPHRLASSQTEMLGPLRILWNSGCSSDLASRTSEVSKFLDDDKGFVSYETVDKSVVKEEVGCEDSKVVHTQESFTKFLRPMGSATELKDVAQACYLSNLAYIISEIKVCQKLH